MSSTRKLDDDEMSQDEFAGTQPLADPGSDLAVYKSTMPTRMRIVLPDQSEQVYDSFSPYLIIGRKTTGGTQAIDIDLAPFDRGVLGISRVHARIMPDYDGLVLQDLKSTNGTHLNGQTLRPNRTYPLKSGDFVKFGNIRVKIILEYASD